MNGDSRRAVLGPSNAELAFYWFHRVIAAYCLMFGVLYWVRLIGIYDGPAWRFDLMPVHWQVASVTLAALFPFAAIGLWMLASWGPVVWLICALAEALMYAGFPHLFGEKLLIVISHLCVALIYLAIRIAIYFQHRAENRQP